jgi:hypothetical protein
MFNGHNYLKRHLEIILNNAFFYVKEYCFKSNGERFDQVVKFLFNPFAFINFLHTFGVIN